MFNRERKNQRDLFCLVNASVNIVTIFPLHDFRISNNCAIVYVYKDNEILNPCNLGAAAATVYIFVEEQLRGFYFSLDYLIYPRMDFSVVFKSIFDFFLGLCVPMVVWPCLAPPVTLLDWKKKRWYAAVRLLSLTSFMAHCLTAFLTTKWRGN